MSVKVMKQVLESFEELVGLMDDTIVGTYKPDSFTTQPALKSITDLRKAIEQAEQAEQAEKQEPVAWMWQHDETGRTGFVDTWQVENGWLANNQRCKLVYPLYTAPAPPVAQSAREWVSLTDEELIEAEDTGEKSYRRWKSSIRGNMVMPQDSLQWHISRAIESKLKEKNT
jgi:hypothetical protein